MTLTATRRRPTGLLLALVGIAVVVGAVSSALISDDSPLVQLRRRIDEAGTPARFEYTYRRGGTRVLDCVLANTTYVGDVDRDASALVVRSTADGEPVAARTADTVLVHQSLFNEAPFTTPWLRLARRPDATSTPGLRRALGDLAADVLAADLPVPGEAVARAALEVATGVEELGQDDIDGEDADRYRISVDPERYAAAATTTLTTGGDDDGPVPVIDVWVTGHGVARVAVTPARPDGTPGASEDGWVIDYRTSIGPVALPTPADADVTELSAVDSTALTPAPTGCQLSG